MNTTTTNPKFLMASVTIEAKAEIQQLRKELNGTEKQIITALLRVAANNRNQILDELAKLKGMKSVS